jgi:phytoene synthase
VSASTLSPAASLVRRHDPDRFFTALFAPPARRETLLVLYAFNHELARAREVGREPTMALIRLQWWREVVEGAPRRHEVAEPLGEAIDAGLLDRTDLDAIITGREAEAEPALPTLSSWQDYVRSTAGGLSTAAGRLLGADTATVARLRDLGTAYGVAGQLRSVSPLAGQGRCLLPLDLLGAHGLTAEAVIARPDDPRLFPVVSELAEWGRQLLRQAGGRLPRHVLASALPAVLARRDLQRVGKPPAARGLSDRLAVLTAAARSHV